MMKTANIFTIFFLFLTAAFAPSCFSQQPHAGNGEKVSAERDDAPVHTVESEILSYVNEYRSSKGLSPLTTNAVIAEQAQIHSMNMASKKTPFSHDGFEERVKNISQRLGAIHASAENVASGKVDARRVVDLWLKSPGHRKNIEGKFQLTGIGIATAEDGTVYFTQIFTL